MTGLITLGRDPLLTVDPATTTRPATVDLDASGLVPGTRYNLRIDGSVVATGRAKRDGTLAGGAAIGSSSRLGSHPVDVRDSANQATLASASLSVVAALPAPVPPGPEPAPAPAGVLWPPGDTISQLYSLAKDPSVPEVWFDGTYRCPELYFDGDYRKGKPLRIGSAPGKTHMFVGPGSTLGGQFFIGLNAPLIGPIAFDGIRAGGGIKLAKAGIFELRRATGVDVVAPYAEGDIRDANYVTKDGLRPLPYHTWLVYGSSKKGGGLHRVRIIDAHGVGVNRSWSLIQFDSGEEEMSDVQVINAKAEHCAYLLYGNIPGTNIGIDGLTAIDTGQGGTAVHWLQGAGTYRRVLETPDALSGKFVNDVPGQMVKAA